MVRSASRIVLILLSFALLTDVFSSLAYADGPALTAAFGIAGHYRPGGWCPVLVTVRNPDAAPLSGQLQALTLEDNNGRTADGRPPPAAAPSVVFACPVTVSGVSSETFPLYLRGIDPGQADLTVQLVEGRERGDGRVLATINTVDPHTSAAFTGGPIGANDQLLVGFGGDPGAFLFLNGRHLAGATPIPTNRRGAGMLPATLQVAEAASASDLPANAAGYDGVDSFLLRSDAPLDGLTPAQTDALKGWVASGGHLIVCGGSDPAQLQSAFFDGLLPATVGSSSKSGALNLIPKPLPGVQTLSSAPDGSALIVSGPYGAGTVILTAGTPTAPAAWQTLLADRPRAGALLSLAAAREENLGGGYYYGGYGQPLLSEAVMRGPSLDAPGTPVIGAFLLVYLIVLVPANYLVLKRFDRKEWAWITIPVLVFLFAAGTFGVGYAAKGGSVFVNRASLIETRAGRSEAGVYGELGLFSPRRTTYDIALSGANLTAAVPDPGYRYGSRGNPGAEAGPARFVQTPSGVSLPDTPVNMWAMRAFDTQSTVDLGGAIDGSLAEKNSRITGTLVNHTSRTLTDCSLLCAGRWVSLGALAPGANVPINAAAGIASQPGSASYGLAALPEPGAAESDIHRRMQMALADYFRSLGQLNPNYSGGAGSSVYDPAPDEALFVGWSRDPKLAGPAPQVDGRVVTENDVSLVVVHVPVAAQ